MPDTSELFDLLAADVRRRLLILLCETDPVRVPEGLNTRGSVQSRHTQDSEQIQWDRPRATTAEAFELELYHTHLPKLEEQGIIEWDTESRSVSRGPTFEEIEPALHALVANADKFPTDLV